MAGARRRLPPPKPWRARSAARPFSRPASRRRDKRERHSGVSHHTRAVLGALPRRGHCRLAGQRTRRAGVARAARDGRRRRLARRLRGLAPRAHGPRRRRRPRRSSPPPTRPAWSRDGTSADGGTTARPGRRPRDLEHVRERPRPGPAVVAVALAAGSRLFDSSPMYGAAESLGGALAPRAHALVATKIWAEPLTRPDAVRRPARWFGRVELEQVHNLVTWEEHLPWLEEERDAGRIDRLGVTHWQASAFESSPGAEDRPLLGAQVPYNPLEQECERAAPARGGAWRGGDRDAPARGQVALPTRRPRKSSSRYGRSASRPGRRRCSSGHSGRADRRRDPGDPRPGTRPRERSSRRAALARARRAR